MSYDNFRDNDNVGHESSFWYRATRQLFERQSPIPKMTCLSLGPTANDQLALGLFALTDNNRLIYWPALSKSETMYSEEGIAPVFDHITLEFPKQRFHLTTYDKSGEKVKVADSLGTYRFLDADSSMWFQVLVKIDLLRTQDRDIQRKIQVSKNHKDNLVKWLKGFAENLSFQRTFLPSLQNADYVCYSLFLTSDCLSIQRKLSSGDVVNNVFLDKYVDERQIEKVFNVYWSQFKVANHDLCIAAACPPGLMRIPLAFQFPRRSSQAKFG